MSNLFVFGLGYSALHFLRSRNLAAPGTVTNAGKAAALRGEGRRVFVFDGAHADEGIASALAGSDSLLASVPPDAGADPVLAHFASAIASSRIERIVYLSTIGVYGDHAGAWIDETTTPAPVNPRSRERLAAEQAWQDLGVRTGKRVFVLRLAGIYGPGQNAVVNLRRGTARRIVKPGQVFNRIHVEDIARAIEACLATPGKGGVFNVTDDEPSPAQDVVAYAAELIGVAPPPELDFATANLSAMARSFYGESKRVSNRRLKDELGVRLAYPTWREGMQALAASEGG